MRSILMLIFGVTGMFLSLRIFNGIVAGELKLLGWQIKYVGNQRAYWSWVTAGALLCLALFFAALKCYLGPLWN